MIKEEERINNELTAMSMNNKISEAIHESWHSNGGVSPRLYGLCKVPKVDLLLRLVVSSPGSSYH